MKISSRPRSSKERQRDRQRSNKAYASTQAYANPQPTIEFSDLEISDNSSDNENEYVTYQTAEYNPSDYLNTTYRSDYQYYTDDNAIRYKPIKIKEFEMQKPIIFKGQQGMKGRKGGPGGEGADGNKGQSGDRVNLFSFENLLLSLSL